MSYRRFSAVLPFFFLFCVLLIQRPAPAHAEKIHVVQYGETLFSIATLYGLPMEDVTKANYLVNPNLIYLGQELIIPIEEEPVEEEQPIEEEVVEENVDSTNEEVVTEIEVVEPVKQEIGRMHIVEYGDTLTSISLRYGVTLQELLAVNRLFSPHLIYIGQHLIIPQEKEENNTPVENNSSKRIIVDKSEQHAYVYENGRLLHDFVISTGQPGVETWEGTWYIKTKMENAYATTWDLQMPYWLGFYDTGELENGFHALPILSDGTILWDGYLGTPVSYGCVILSYPDAETLFNWSDYGTEVVVQP